MPDTFASFRSAYRKRASLPNPDLIEFDSSRYYQIFISTAKSSGTCKYLIRPQYRDLWKSCEDRLLSDSGSPTHKQTVVIGTAGIGKSAARLLYICMWLENESPAMAMFDKVIFNTSNQFFAVDKDGSFKHVNIYVEPTLNSLLLLDPCDFLNNAQSIACAMLMVFTSPSGFLSQPGKPNLSGLGKSSATYVLDPPTVQDLNSLGLQYDEKRLEDFSWVKGRTRYCALRWFTFEESEIPTKVKECVDNISRDGLWDWFTTNTTSFGDDNRLPFRLCVIEKSETRSWVVTGFISPAIEHFLFEWSMQVGSRRAHEVANILENRSLRGGLGIFFERWLFEKLGQGVKLQIADSGSTSEISFSELQNMDESSIGRKENVVYKVDRANFPSIEGYAIAGKTIYFLQSTVSKTHTGARYSDVKRIVGAVATKPKMDLVVIYIAPTKIAFKIPKCVGFPEQTKVLRGSVDDTDFYGIVKARQRLGLKGAITAVPDMSGAAAEASSRRGKSEGSSSDKMAGAGAHLASASDSGGNSGVQGIASYALRKRAGAVECDVGGEESSGTSVISAGRYKKQSIVRSKSEAEDEQAARAVLISPKKGGGRARRP